MILGVSVLQNLGVQSVIDESGDPVYLEAGAHVIPYHNSLLCVSFKNELVYINIICTRMFLIHCRTLKSIILITTGMQRCTCTTQVLVLREL